MINKEISIVVGRVRVVGTLDATPESLSVQITSPFKNLKHSVRFSGAPTGDRRFACNGKLSNEALQRAKEILKGLYSAGLTLKEDPELVTKLRRYMARFEKTASSIHQEQKQAMMKYDEGKLSKKAHDTKLAEFRQAEHQNVIGRGVIFRRYADQIAQRSGGRVDIQSVLEFTS